MSVDYHLALSDHYKAVRARLNSGLPPRPVAIAPPPEPVLLTFEPEPEPEPEPALPALPPDPLPGAMCSFSTKWAILPVLDRHGLTWQGLIARNNRMEYVNARAEIYVLLRERKWSYLQIAKLVSRDHTTVINSVQRYHARKETK
jgi:hypothetical protein